MEQRSAVNTFRTARADNADDGAVKSPVNSFVTPDEEDNNNGVVKSPVSTFRTALEDQQTPTPPAPPEGPDGPEPPAIELPVVEVPGLPPLDLPDVPVPDLSDLAIPELPEVPAITTPEPPEVNPPVVEQPGVDAPESAALTGLGQHIHLQYGQQPRAGKTIRVYARITDYAFNDEQPTNRPTAEVSVILSDGTISITQREKMVSVDEDSPFDVSGSVYFIDVKIPKDRAVDIVRVAATVVPRDLELINPTPNGINNTLSNLLSGDVAVDAPLLSTLIPPIDSVDIVIEKNKLDVLGIATKGLLQFK